MKNAVDSGSEIIKNAADLTVETITKSAERASSSVKNAFEGLKSFWNGK